VAPTSRPLPSSRVHTPDKNSPVNYRSMNLDACLRESRRCHKEADSPMESSYSKRGHDVIYRCLQQSTGLDYPRLLKAFFLFLVEMRFTASI